MYLFNVAVLFLTLLAICDSQFYGRQPGCIPSFGGGGEGDGGSIYVPQLYGQRPRRMQAFDLGDGGGDGDGGNGGGNGGAGGGGSDGGGDSSKSGNECGGDSGSISMGGSCGRSSKNWNNSGSKLPGSTENAKQHSSGIALQAAKEAKKANDEMAPAVKAAADKIKTEYAEKATAAANAADAVLFGKGQLLEQLEAEVCNAKSMLEPEIQKLNNYEGNDQLANKAISLSKRQLKQLSVALKTAKEKLCAAEELSDVWEKSVMDNSLIMDAAQKRVNMLLPILNEVLADREKTRKAAETAAMAAQEAKSRVEQMEKDTQGPEKQDQGRQRRAWPYNQGLDMEYL